MELAAQLVGRRILDYNTQSSYLGIWDNFQWDCGPLELLMTGDNGELGGKYASLESAGSEGERGTKRQEGRGREQKQKKITSNYTIAILHNN